MSLQSLKDAALAEVAKIENAAVAEYLKVKTSNPDWKVVAAVAFALGVVLGLIL